MFIEERLNRWFPTAASKLVLALCFLGLAALVMPG